jgi:hypothetical protein
MDITIEVVHGWRLLARVRELIVEPGVQRLVLRNEQGDTLFVVEGAALRSDATTRPILAAVKAVADELPRVTLEVVRDEDLVREVGVATGSEEFDRAIDVIEPVFERY